MGRSLGSTVRCGNRYRATRAGLWPCRPLLDLEDASPGLHGTYENHHQVAESAVGEVALPDVALRLVGVERLVAPDVGLAVQPAAGGELPLRLGRQPLAGPLRVSAGVVPGDVDDGMVRAALDGA